MGKLSNPFKKSRGYISMINFLKEHSYTMVKMIINQIGIAFFGLAALFQAVTLPVEFNASKRAMKALEGSFRFTEDELDGSKKVLTAAALTYVAALATSLAQILRLLVIVGGRRRD